MDGGVSGDEKYGGGIALLELGPLVGQTLGMLLFIDDEARVPSAADRLHGIADFSREHHLAPVHRIDFDVNTDILAERSRADVLHLDVDSDRAFAVIEVLGEQAKTRVLHVIDHVWRAVHAHVFAQKADRAFRVNGDCFAAGEAGFEGVFHDAKISSGRCEDYHGRPSAMEGTLPPIERHFWPRH